MMRRRLPWPVVVAGAYFLACISTVAANEKLIGKAEALAIARRAAAAHGYDLKHYKLDTFGDPGALGISKWFFVFNCSPGPVPPGCHFFVEVNRHTGVSVVQPGE